MNTKIGQLVSTLLIIGLALFWSVSILAADNVAAGPDDAAETSVAIAADATEEAVDAAVASIAKDNKIELDNIELDLPMIDRSSLQVAAD